VTQKVQAKEPEVVLRTQNSNVHLPQPDHLGALENTIGLLLVELAEAQVQIYQCPSGVTIL